MEKLFDMHAKIRQLKSEIYILLIDDLFMDASKAEAIVEDNLFIIGGNRNPEIVKKINNKFHQIKELQSVLGIS